MAEEQLQGADAPKGKSKLLIIIIAVVVLLGGGGAAAFFLMGSDDSAQAAEAESQQTQAAAANPIAYVNLPQPFIFNVTGDRRDRLVQIKAQLWYVALRMSSWRVTILRWLRALCYQPLHRQR